MSTMKTPLPIHEPEVITQGWGWIRVCVPDDWPEREIEKFANFEMEPEVGEEYSLDYYRSIELCHHREGFVHRRLEL